MGSYLQDFNKKMLLFEKEEPLNFVPSARTASSAERQKKPMLSKFKSAMSMSKGLVGSFKMRSSINEPEPNYFNTGK
jgi:hypothetical protein